ncbi:MAG: hypothetical protein Fur0035_20540 [Anaerolineales bacterium]
MTTNITLIGLGQIGASLGLALKPYAGRIQRLGHDKNPETAQWARQLGALDQVDFNLHHAVEAADLVILALPVHEISATLEQIAADLKEGAVVLETAPLKAPLLAAAAKILPAGRYFIGLVPAISPALLSEPGRAPRADFFAHAALGIVAPQGTPAEALKLVTDLAQLLQAEPFFLDVAEADSLMAAVHLLPQLMGAALLNVTAGRPGWGEGRRLAGRPYVGAVSAPQETPEALTALARLNRVSALRVLDEALVELQKLRAAIDAEEEGELLDALASANLQGERWFQERQTGDWLAVEMGKKALPETPGFFGNLFGKRKK